MLIETNGQVEMWLDQEAIRQAVKNFLNEHVLKDGIEVVNVSYEMNPSNYKHAYRVRCLTTLGRLAGEEGATS